MIREWDQRQAELVAEEARALRTRPFDEQQYDNRTVDTLQTAGELLFSGLGNGYLNLAEGALDAAADELETYGHLLQESTFDVPGALDDAMFALAKRCRMACELSRRVERAKGTQSPRRQETAAAGTAATGGDSAAGTNATAAPKVQARRGARRTRKAVRS